MSDKRGLLTSICAIVQYSGNAFNQYFIHTEYEFK